jgi:hypothetical protein
MLSRRQLIHGAAAVVAASPLPAAAQHAQAARPNPLAHVELPTLDGGRSSLAAYRGHPVLLQHLGNVVPALPTGDPATRGDLARASCPRSRGRRYRAGGSARGGASLRLPIRGHVPNPARRRREVRRGSRIRSSDVCVLEPARRHRRSVRGRDARLRHPRRPTTHPRIRTRLAPLDASVRTRSQPHEARDGREYAAQPDPARSLPSRLT